MSLETILTRCKEINAAIEGIISAHDHTDLPQSLNTSELPALLALPRLGEMRYSASDAVRTSHRIRLLLIGSPIGQGDIAQRLSALVPFVQRVRNAYASAVRLNALDGIAYAVLTNYEFVTIAYSGIEYAALDMTLEVHEQEAITVEV